MPRIGVYVSTRDKELLDELPGDVSVSALLREGIAHYRRQGKECEHPNRVELCLDCGHRSVIETPDDDHLEDTATG